MRHEFKFENCNKFANNSLQQKYEILKEFLYKIQ